MCETIAVDPANFAVAKRLRTRVYIVVAVRAALAATAARAEIPGDVSGFDSESWGALLGLKAERIAAIVAALADKGVIVDGRLADWRNERNGATSRALRPARTGAERSQDWRDRRRAAAQAAEIADCDESDGATLRDVAPSPLLKEERGSESLSLSRKEARAGDIAEQGKAARRQRWLSNMLIEAHGRLPPDRYEKLVVAACEEKIPRWAQTTLDQLDAIVKARQGRAPPWHGEPQLPMPLGGGGGGRAAAAAQYRGARGTG